jgi:riboflavin kinase/FMN adenylyltransferase
LGTFDGVHIGHQKILERIIDNTANNKYESLVLTFFPSTNGFTREFRIKLLNTMEENPFNGKQIQNLVIHPFDTVFSQLTAVCTNSSCESI